MSITIGVDIGGSHISSAAVNSDGFKIIPGTYFSGSVDSKSSKEVIIERWAEIINQTIHVIQEALAISADESLGIAFSMP
jgi:glucokinase